MLNLTQTQRLQQKLSPAQVQYLKILQLPVLALEQKIKDELELNPLLEESLEQEEENDKAIDSEFENESTEGEDATDPDALSTDSGNGEEDDFIEKEIRENKEEEYSWEEFFENNEGHASVNFYDGDDDREIPTPARVTMRENLIDQIPLLYLSDRLQAFAELIVWNVDDDGYLRRKLADVAEDFRIEQQEVLTIDEAEQVLQRVQRLDPAAIGSRSLQECLLIQLELLPNTSTERIIAIRLLRDAYDLFRKKHFEKIEQQLLISHDMLKRAYELIKTLSPKPGESDAQTGTNYIVPDFFVNKEDGDYIVTLNDRGVPPLRVNKAYKQLLLNHTKKLTSETKTFLRQKMESAKWFIQSITQRRQTMVAVMTTIIERQREWFDKGVGYLKPMIYKDIADVIEMDISTISRVVNGKYVQTEWGVHELRYFFSEGIPTTSGEEVSNKEVKRIIGEIIEQENARKPLSDEAIMKILRERGFDIARRTVAKYREALGIPVSRLRKQL